MTAKRTPSLMAATAAAVASRAARILDPPIEPEVSMTMTSTPPPPGATPAPKPVPALVPEAEIVTTALTSLAPSGRYSFWKHSRWKSAISLLLALVGLNLRGDLRAGGRLNPGGHFGLRRRLGPGGRLRLRHTEVALRPGRTGLALGFRRTGLGHGRPGGRPKRLHGDSDVVVAPRFEGGVHQAPGRLQHRLAGRPHRDQLPKGGG